jgi:hypothetical protein
VKSNRKLLVGVVAGILAGAAGNHAVHGQQVKTPVYVISEVDAITDPVALKFEAAIRKAWMGTRRPKES